MKRCREMAHKIGGLCFVLLVGEPSGRRDAGRLVGGEAKAKSHVDRRPRQSSAKLAAGQ